MWPTRAAFDCASTFVQHRLCCPCWLDASSMCEMVGVVTGTSFDIAMQLVRPHVVNMRAPRSPCLTYTRTAGALEDGHHGAKAAGRVHAPCLRIGAHRESGLRCQSKSRQHSLSMLPKGRSWTSQRFEARCQSKLHSLCKSGRSEAPARPLDSAANVSRVFRPMVVRIAVRALVWKLSLVRSS